MKVTPGECRGLILLSIMIILLLAYGVYDRSGNIGSGDVISPVADSMLLVPDTSVSLVSLMAVDSVSIFHSSREDTDGTDVKRDGKRKKKSGFHAPRSPLDQPIN